MVEKAKRLEPTKETVRELFGRSGNQCAFPGCVRVMINKDGDFIGQICHIEAAEEGGERFNPDQNNEQRRHVSNLMLMCYDHHVVTDNVEKYGVETLKRYKAEHEARFADPAETILKTIADHTAQSKPLFPSNLERLNQVLGWENTPDMMADCVQEFRDMCQRLARIPRQSREFFCVLVNRSHSTGSIGGPALEVSVPDVIQATQMGRTDAAAFFSILDRAGLTCDNDHDEYGQPLIGIRSLSSGWAVWKDVRRFCRKEKIELIQILASLDFSPLDQRLGADCGMP